ncbi:uncharacterized protein PODANS_5_12908 [Podospora anserina S mat+]|uniref:Podospora anserina S mat+ genomic DNA chromosome 5, supercontig 3 n=1 Tax=Podospora anserina (strain S / ATCC MYA-4624 / DSM 980 / FGSC 10383) TaxID=515849 RepID=B2AFF3_PODAN|nr:uncharacterized protein PODANS_5_12908 [Podospora anserina S mat+]CAP62172.1 unnamed protein product [Podospora anserina S mat+]
MVVLRAKEFVYQNLPLRGIARFLLVNPSNDPLSPLHCSLHDLPITHPTYDFLIPPVQTRKKTRPIVLNGNEAKLQFEIEHYLRYMRHETKEQMFFLRPLCINPHQPDEAKSYDLQQNDLVTRANHVRGFMGKPPKRWDLEQVAKTLREMHALAVNTAARPQDKDAFRKQYASILRLFSLPEPSKEVKSVFERCLELLCNSIWRNRWTTLQTIGMVKGIDLYIGRTSIPIDAFYKLAHFIHDARTLQAWDVLSQLSTSNNLAAASRIARNRMGTLRQLKQWKTKLSPNQPLPPDLEQKLRDHFAREENTSAWKTKVMERQPHRLRAKIKQAMKQRD